MGWLECRVLHCQGVLFYAAELKNYLAEHADTYAGLVVTRMTDGPHPKRCQKHPPMKLTEAHRSPLRKETE